MLIFRGKFLMFFLHLWSLEAHHSHTRLALIHICSRGCPERSAELILVHVQRTGKSPHQTARQLASTSKVHELSRWGVGE